MDLSFLAVVVVALVALASPPTSETPGGSTPEGEWTTFDVGSGTARGLLRISIREGQLAGTIQRVFLRPDESADPICVRCSGTRRNQRIVGMEILHGHRRERERWTGGWILDPENGKEYSSAVWLEGPDRLRVRGYWGPFYRTQTWRRPTSLVHDSPASTDPREGRP